MSLSKRYAIGCESTDLHMRRQRKDRPKVPLEATREERRELRLGCRVYSLEDFSAKAARTEAKRAGWVRYSESLPLYPGAPAEDYSKVVFDICPSCAPKIIPDHIPAPDVHCLECDAPLFKHGDGAWGDVRSRVNGGSGARCPVATDHAHRPAR